MLVPFPNWIIGMMSPSPSDQLPLLAGEVQRPGQLAADGAGPFPQIGKEAELPEACPLLGCSSMLAWI